MSSKKVRKSPQQSATLYKIGTTKIGLDGNKWIIAETQTGTKRWKLHRKKSKSKSRKRKTASQQKKILGTKSFIKKDKLTNKSFTTHYNGGRPFKIIVSKDDIKIYNYEDDKLVLTFKKFIGYWYGYDMHYHYHGNTILIQITRNQYVFVGPGIKSFETSEEILDFISPIGNSDVPYPVAYSDNYVYFMLDNKYVKKDVLKTDAIVANADEIYGEFYKNPKLGTRLKKLKTLAKWKFV